MAVPPKRRDGMKPQESRAHKHQALALLLDAAQAPLSEWPSRYPGYQAMGYLCSYVPEEIIHAAGYSPLRISSTAGPLREVDAHLQSFSCALCRSGLEQALAGELRFTAGMVFAHTCDTMQALADLWSIGTPKAPFVHTIMQPANLGTPAARPYLVAELRRFQDRMAGLRNSRDGISAPGVSLPNDDTLRTSIVLYDETRRLLEALSSQRPSLSTREFFGVLDAAQIMPRERFNDLLSQVLLALVDARSESARPSKTGPGLFLTGAVLDDVRLLELIDDLGARVVGDDLCTGSRHFQGRVGTEAPPLEALADYYLERPPCPTKYHPAHDPAKHLLEQVDSTWADGIVFVLEKFCEPHAFDYAQVLPSLDKAGVPHLLLEMEQTPSLEALRTRLQAFVEMLQ